MLGYDKDILQGRKTFVLAKVPDITRSVDWAYRYGDLTSRRANYVSSDALYSFSTSGLEVSHPFQKEQHRLEWYPVNKSFMNSIRLWVTDGRATPWISTALTLLSA